MSARLFSRFVMRIAELDVTVELKSVKNMSLRVKPEGVFLSAPAYNFDESAAAKFIAANIEWVRLSLKRVRMARQAADGLPSLTREQVQAFILMCRSRFLYWQTAMGLRIDRIAFRLMKSRWGSCNPHKGVIMINVELARYPQECLDYIIVHELAHLVHQDHSAAFWSLVGKYVPDWKRRRTMLRLREVK